MSSDSNAPSSPQLACWFRLADAAEMIAEGLTELAKINRERLNHEFPQRTPENATILKFKPPTSEPRDVAESFPQELWLGPREKKWITRQERKQRAEKSRS